MLNICTWLVTRSEVDHEQCACEEECCSVVECCCGYETTVWCYNSARYTTQRQNDRLFFLWIFDFLKIKIRNHYGVGNNIWKFQFSTMENWTRGTHLKFAYHRYKNEMILKLWLIIMKKNHYANVGIDMVTLVMLSAFINGTIS